MIIVSRSAENGLSWANYGCAVSRSRGESVCSNRKTVSERIANKTVLTLLSDAVRTKEFKAWVQGAMTLAAREHAKDKAENDAAVRLEKDVQTQAALVEKIGNRLIEAGASDFLTARLRAEEIKLRELRHALAKASLPKRATPVTKLDLEVVLALLKNVEKIAEKDPARAREVLATVIEPATLTPGPRWVRDQPVLQKRDGRPRERPSYAGIWLRGRDGDLF
jgi:hypothetical protein